MARSVGSRGRIVTRSTRATDWIESADRSAFLALAAATNLLDQSFQPSESETIVRTRWIISVQSDQVVAGERPFGAVGITIVSAEAFTAGAASIPAPYSNAAHDGWFVH